MITVPISWDKLKDAPTGLYPAPPQYEILRWIHGNCKNPFEYPVSYKSRIPGNTVRPTWEIAKFEDKNDALMFKLAFG